MAGSTLAIAGERTSGEDVRTANVTACLAVANIVRSSLGPVGLDKMLVDEVGDVTVTNDGATILQLLEVEHPAAKVLTELATQQDQEVGDGTTSVVLVAAELLRRGNDLVRTGIHPTSVISGFRMAMRESCKYIRETMAIPVDRMGKEGLVNIARTSLSSKILGGAEIDLFSTMAVDAVLSIKVKKDEGADKYPIEHVHVLKAQGASASESIILPGYALNMTRASQAMPLRVAPVKVACIDFDLRRAKLKMGISVVISEPEELAKIQKNELDITKKRIELLLKSGANLILTTKGIDDTALKYFSEAKAIACRRVSMKDLKRIARATGASIQVSLADWNGDEAFDPSFLGYAEEVYEETIRDDKVLIIKGCRVNPSCTVLLRGPNEYMCDEMSRSFHDAVSVVKRTLESNTLVPGGGAVEAALSIHLDNFASLLGTREQLAVSEFAESLLVIPKTLAVNAAKDATDLVAKLRAVHALVQSDSNAKKELAYCGLDLVEGKIRNNIGAGVVEPAMSKIRSIQFATEAAITILRIDDLIKLNPKERGAEEE
eukprot:CAMPEP_0184682132 /NCGR_PEP_ID=MMETSP0312-20130426/5959_1 /TAXON_ID=31354 /ORGANISM="Compsopogon coeruleus, Strain SAG 36.94" /LENGTH=546 /DNA_ID=CAMNT_0027133537 /DNA_START=72 /DNA_END=1712 /DNA_ORIENTATION=-